MPSAIGSGSDAAAVESPGAVASRPLTVVGIGASAGGIQAFRDLLEHLPPDLGLAYVVVTHLDPTHESVLSEILSRNLRMEVAEVAEGDVQVQPDHVYVRAPDTTLILLDGRLHVHKGAGVREHPPRCVDQFFASLAESLHENAIGVILSGSASDGSAGIRAIKDAGGITFAQDESAQFADMPRSAIATGAVDYVLPPTRIADELTRIARGPALAPSALAEPSPAPEAGPALLEDGIHRILRLLNGATGVDFSQYKQTTVRRRLARRMALRRLEDLNAYIEILEDNPAEIRALHDDILINVTSFFREPGLFAALKADILPRIVTGRAAHEPVRIWVPGCSTGEEVYSLAITLLEFYAEHGVNLPAQLFGTDVSDVAVDVARAGVYGGAQVNDLSPERLERFFTRNNRGSYQVAKLVRDLCVFARQDLVRDPPFSRMDLVSCRNVLIYLGPALQRRVLPLFHYALRPNGYLVLGSSESVGPFSHLFSVVDKTQKIFQKMPGASAMHLDTLLLDGPRPAVGRARADAEVPPLGFDAGREADRILLTHYVPAAIVVDESGHIVHVRGETGPYLRPAPGKPSLHLLKMAREDLVLDLDRTLRTARETGVLARREGVVVRADGQLRDVTIEVSPLRVPGAPPGLFLVLLRGTSRPAEEPQPAAGGEAPSVGSQEIEIARLREELSAGRTYHQAMVEKYEAANEALRSAHEEVLSANEELQSTNEEVETAKEELQSTNEELATLNDELQQRNAELAQLNGDLENLFASVNIPIALVDGSLRLRRITPPAERLFNVLPSDVNRRITDFKHNFEYGDLEQAIVSVLDSLTTVDREIQDRDGHWFSLRIRPYRSFENKVEGAVIVLTDIHAIKTSLLENERGRVFMEAVFETVPEPILVLDSDLCVRTANRSYYRMFDATPQDTQGRAFFQIGDRRWDLPAIRALIDGVATRNERFDDHEVVTGNRTLLISARRVDAGNRPEAGVLLVVDDVTERRRAEVALLRSEERLSAIFNQAFAGIAQTDLSGRMLLVNARFCGILTREEGQVLGMRFRDLVFAEDQPKSDDAFQRAMAGSDGFAIEMRLLRKDGTPVWVSSDVSVLKSVGGKPEYALLIIQEITARKKAEQEVLELTTSLDRRVKERTAELEDAVSELNNFSYTVSHDLRAPLRGMNALSQLLLRNFPGQVLDVTGEDYVRRIAAAAARMDALVVNLLAYSRLGRVEMLLAPTALEPVVDEVVGHLHDDIVRTGGEVTIERPLPAVVAYRVTLAQALENLIDNALKFVPDGVSPRVHVRAERVEGNVRIWVEDNGLGIAPEHQSRIFGVFERLHRFEEFPGTGIGLAIVRRAIERMGGTVGVASELGKGSRFWICLPEAPAT